MAKHDYDDLKITSQEKRRLIEISKSRTESASKIQRSKFILMFLDRNSRKNIAEHFNVAQTTVQKCINKAKAFGVITALSDLPRAGRSPAITEEAKIWLVNIACRKPVEFNYPHELWTASLLRDHIRKSCAEFGYRCLDKVSKSTISRILNSNEIKPHKVRYYMDKHDPDFETKQREVLYFYKKVEDIIDDIKEGRVDIKESYLSYDEKPGIQAVENKYSDINSKQILRDYEYIRHGTLSLMAGIDLMSGKVINHIVNRHRSKEFIEFLKILDEQYPKDYSINILLDNHIIHKSKETLKYLQTRPNRFNFTFTPKHASWLNIIEVFFSKIARTLLKGIRVKSKEELKDRLNQYFNNINLKPVRFKWKYKMDNINSCNSGTVY
jgi:transposase